MKKIILFLLLAVATNIVSAQKFRLNAYGAYVFDDGFDSFYDNYDYYNGKIKGGFQWGGGLEYLINERFSLEVFYLHQGTNAPTYYQEGITDPVNYSDFDLKLDYILLGGQTLVTHSSGKIEGYGGLIGGVVIADLTEPSSGRNGSVTKFAWGGRLGGNIWATEKFGIKVQAQLLMASQVTGGSFYFGPGAGYAVGTYSTIYQFGLGGGLIFRFGRNKSMPPPSTF